MEPLSQIQSDDILAASNFESGFITTQDRSQPHRTFLFGYPIAHSLAPVLHATLFRGVSLPWTYELYETQHVSAFLPALKQPDVIGCAVTMPYKVAVMPLVDQVTEEGQMIGAINTVFLRRNTDGSIRYIGTNTDCVGVREAFLRNFPNIGIEAAGKPALVIGAGGACRAAVYALWKWLGASRVYVVNRLESEVAAVVESFRTAGCGVEIVHVSSPEQAAALETPVLVVGTVPDMPLKEPGEIIARSIVNEFLASPKKGYILEMCYHPKPKTDFFNLGERAGWKMMYGTESMIWQGVAQQTLWAEIPLEEFKLDDAHKAIREALQGHK
ncbi:hypothetical protein SEUCBS139899_007897 [Sporothrix eucalyptigena]|uniref:Shikimate dehydrogenase substrate binding N-terminal domain-containing protein n=1 Tax=Sporothrix eucalyptigena TaxID=1812306 RepID=A0ABP0C8R9_9PEZI